MDTGVHPSDKGLQPLPPPKVCLIKSQTFYIQGGYKIKFAGFAGQFTPWLNPVHATVLNLIKSFKT